MSEKHSDVRYSDRTDQITDGQLENVTILLLAEDAGKRKTRNQCDAITFLQQGHTAATTDGMRDLPCILLPKWRILLNLALTTFREQLRNGKMLLLNYRMSVTHWHA